MSFEFQFFKSVGTGAVSVSFKSSLLGVYYAKCHVIRKSSVRGGAFSYKPYLALGFAFLLACTPPAEESEESERTKASCGVSASGNVQVGSEYTADLSCQLPGIYQGKKLQIIYGENVNSLKLVVGEEEQEGQNGKIVYKLPAKPTFDAKVKLTASTAGADQLSFRILSAKSKWEYTAVQAGSSAPAPSLGASVTASSFDSMKDSNNKTYTRGILKLGTAHAVSSHDTLGACSTTAGTVLISSDNFVNCEAVHKYVPVFDSFLVPKAEWKPSTTYKIGVRLSDGNVSKFQKSGVDVSFTTNDLTHDTSGTLSLGSPSTLRLKASGKYQIVTSYSNINDVVTWNMIKDRCPRQYSGYQNLNGEKMRLDTTYVRANQVNAFPSSGQYRVYVNRDTTKLITTGVVHLFCTINLSPRP